jgi:2-keto-4-pentenoate hydratase/2-oxohepta-3-ene-1,7-dioic acid hydratase in catechol pathway
MRLVTYSVGPAGPARAGVRVGHRILDIETASRVKGEPLPASIKALLAAGRGAMSRVQALAKAATSGAGPFSHALHEERAVRLLPPMPDADRFLCLGRNYRQHPDEPDKASPSNEIAQDPAAFVKLNTSLVGQDAKVARPAGVVRLDCEPELVFVIGRHALGVKKEDAMDYVAGVTILSDLICRDLQEREAASGSGLPTARNCPGFGPLGPEIVTMDEIADPYDLWMTCSVNGAERTRVNTRDQVWKLPDILEHFSRHIPLEPGDLFSTGAPSGGVAGKAGAAELFLKPGDVVECSIEGIATLRTTIVAPGDA